MVFVKPGDRVKVVLSKRPKTKEDGPDTSGAGTRRGVLDGALEDDDLILLRRKQITFHDLGARLRSAPSESSRLFLIEDNVEAPEHHDGWVNEYVEVRAEYPLNFLINVSDGRLNTASGMRLSSENWASYQAKLLAKRVDPEHAKFDPFGSTPANGSGRSLPNCMQIPFDESYRLGLELTLRRAGSTPKTYAITDDMARNEGEWKGPEKAHEGETWNSLNVSDKTALHEGTLKPKSGDYKGVDGFSVKSPSIAYEQFDTYGPNYKLTSEPSYGAPAADFPRNPKALRIYLVPRIVASYRQYVARARRANIILRLANDGRGASGVAIASTIAWHGWYASRLPIHPWAKLDFIYNFPSISTLSASGSQALKDSFDRAKLFDRTILETSLNSNPNPITTTIGPGKLTPPADIDAVNTTALDARLAQQHAEITSVVNYWLNVWGEANIPEPPDTPHGAYVMSADSIYYIGMPKGQLVGAFSVGSKVYYVWWDTDGGATGRSAAHKVELRFT